MKTLFYAEEKLHSKLRKEEFLQKLMTARVCVGGFYYNAVQGKDCDCILCPKPEGLLHRNSFAPLVGITAEDCFDGTKLHLTFRPYGDKSGKIMTVALYLFSITFEVVGLMLLSNALNGKAESIIIASIYMVLPIGIITMFRRMFRKYVADMIGQLPL